MDNQTGNTTPRPRHYRGVQHWIPEGYFLMHWPSDVSSESLDFIEEHIGQWLKTMRRSAQARESSQAVPAVESVAGDGHQ